MIKLKGKSLNISIIQVYALTQDHEDEEIELFFDEIQTAIKNVKTGETLCVNGEFKCYIE